MNPTRLIRSFNRFLALLIGLFTWISIYGQSNANYTIFVAGHAYGAHAGSNIGLHPPLLKKWQEQIDSNVVAAFLTGDIVNQSTSASWAQVEHELTDLGLKSCYVMGNHDNNTIGMDVFKKKHGGAYYSFVIRNDLYVVLNSTESNRSISSIQLKFLTELLQNKLAIDKRVFIFFHEVIWNSHEKYKLLRSNSRSRYDLIKSVSNFWQKVFPLLTSYPELKFYLFAGDVGGNPDAIAASYDRWENVTLVSSGMGEVADENYLKVNILPDTVEFTLIPLNNSIQMKPVAWYNVPEKPLKIDGPATVLPQETSVWYQVSPVFNATSYSWNLSDGISGISDSTANYLHFQDNFQKGQIEVKAVNDGFGESEPVVLEVQSSDYTSVPDKVANPDLNILQNQLSILVDYYSEKRVKANLKIFNSSGMLLVHDEIFLNEGVNRKNVDHRLIGKGLNFIELSFGNKRLIKKIIIF